MPEVFNDQVIFESWKTQFAGAQNQSLAAGVLGRIFERLWLPDHVPTPTPSWIPVEARLVGTHATSAA